MMENTVNILVEFRKCPKCNYKWQARTMKPKNCPRCKSRFDYFERD